MKDKVKFIPLILVLLLFTMACSSPGEESELYFFYFESCPSCEDYQRAEEYKETILRIDKKRDWKGGAYNLTAPDNVEILKNLLKEKNLPDISRSLPLLITEKDYINGYDEIGERLESLSSE